MEKINQTLQRLAHNENFQKRYQEIRNQVLNHPDIKAFFTENRDRLNRVMIEKSITKLYEYISQSRDCKACESLGNCKNMMQGFHPKLVITPSAIDIQYERCPLKIVDDEKRKSERLIKSLHVPKDILSASFEKLEQDPSRFEVIKKAALFVKNYDPDHPPKGLYLFGKFGVGKSYLLGAIANELAKNKISSMIVYVPEMFRELKNSIGDSSLNDKIDMLKKEPVLMLDDIGAEAVSSWTRDEILGPILQFRMLENLPTFFTSNFNMEQLEYHLSHSQRGEEEKMKGRRIIERIRCISEPVEVAGPNRRL